MNYPVSTFVAPIYVVDSLKNDNGLNGFNIISNHYEDAILHKQGKGFLGFRKFSQLNHTNNSKVVSTTEMTPVYYTLSAQTVETFVGDDTISKKVDTYKVKPINGVHIFISIEKSESKDLLKNINTSTAFDYDNKGNLTNEKTLVNTDFSSVEKNYNSFDDFGNPAFVTTKTIRRNEKPFLDSQSFTYNSKGKISTSLVNGLKTQIFYDHFGNPDSIIKGEGDSSRIIVYRFSNDGRFVECERNILGHASYTSWNNIGNAIQKTDINGLSTIYIYDSWGKLTESFTPENILLKQSLEWVRLNDADAPEKTLYFTKTIKDNLFNGSEYFDFLGRSVRKVTVGYEGAKYYSDSKYNEKGQLVEVSQSYQAGTSTDKKIIFTYDHLGRKKTETLINGVIKTFNYVDNERKVITSLSTGESYTKIHDPMGIVIEAIDPGGAIGYVYNSAGKPRLVQSPGSQIEIKYDSYGRQDTLIDPNAGIISYSYNFFGELVSQTGAKGEKTSIKYDRLGRVIENIVGNVATVYTYDEGIRSLGTTTKIIRNDGAANMFKYSNDGFCRLLTNTNKYGTDSFDYQYEYDTKGRIKKEIYPSGFSVNYTYSEYDDLLEIKNENGKSIWKINAVNSQNDLLKTATYGNGKQITFGYDAFDRLNKIFVPQVIDFNYQFNNKQQLDWRDEKYYTADSAKWKGFKEEFTYDEVNRLKTATGGKSLNIEYVQNKIYHKSDAGTYNYQNGNHRLDELTAVTGYIPPQHHLIFTIEGKVDSLMETRDSANVRLLTFKYGLDNERFSMQYKVNDTLKYTRFYVGKYEKESYATDSERALNYVYANGKLVGIFEQSNQEGTMHYVYTDYLGSIRCITDSMGNSEKILGFDAWGNRRDPLTGMPDTSAYANLLTPRGYTGHEHLDEVGLINMNGRVYDPQLGIFISPDNFIQAPDFTQNYNRYGYCLNNPLMYSDPSGNLFWTPIIVGAIVGGISNGITTHARGGDFFDGAW
jgi:RHS repeat-associated protein